MPGCRRVSYDFPDGTPKPLQTLFAVLFTNFPVNFILSMWVERRAPRQPSSAFSYPIHFKGGLVVYVRPAMGQYLEWGFWAHFILLGMIFLMFWYYERTGRAVRGG